MSADTRYVYGAYCTWHGPISEVDTTAGLPICPRCGSVLFEMEDKAEWLVGVNRFAKEINEPLYPNFIEAQRDPSARCVRNPDWLKLFAEWKQTQTGGGRP
jgi:hypothetical protein